jgi:hypothetical protein
MQYLTYTHESRQYRRSFSHPTMHFCLTFLPLRYFLYYIHNFPSGKWCYYRWYITVTHNTTPNSGNNLAYFGFSVRISVDTIRRCDSRFQSIFFWLISKIHCSTIIIQKTIARAQHPSYHLHQTSYSSNEKQQKEQHSGFQRGPPP